MNLIAKAGFGFSLFKYLLTKRPAPLVISWLITGRCNQLCSYCKWKHLRNSWDVHLDQIIPIIDDMAKAGVRVLSFTGGEPLLREDIGEIIRYVKSKGIACKLNTNGSLVPGRLDELMGLDLLQISLDGPSGKHDDFRGKDSSQQAVLALKSAKERGIPVQAVACLTNQNIDHLEQVVDIGVAAGIKVAFQPLSALFLDHENMGLCVPSRDKLLAGLRYLVQVKSSRSLRSNAISSSYSELRYLLNSIERNQRGCLCPLLTATILPDGSMIFCGNAKEQPGYDVLQMGFSEAFSKIRIPDCDGCVCVGKLKLAQISTFDFGSIRELTRL